MTHVNQRRDLASTWTALNPVLQLGEVGWERDTRKNKIGDGSTAWNDLAYSHPVTKEDIGLGLVDNTSDSNKPISSATQAALNLKAPLASPAFTGTPTAPTPAPADDDTSIATTAFVQAALASLTLAIIPTGLVLPYGGTTEPTGGYLLCNGQAVSRTTYSELFTTIGTTFGPGDGSTTFNVPDMRGRLPVGVGLATGVPGATAKTLAQVGGEETHVLTSGEIPSHTHTINHNHPSHITYGNGDHSHGFNFQVNTDVPTSGGFPRVTDIQDAAGHSGPYFNTATNIAGSHQHNFDIPAHNGSSGSSGGNGAHNNMPPFIGLNYLIKT